VTFGEYVATLLGLDVMWLWLALIGDYFARSVLKAWRFRSGAWQFVRA
jgi:Na+-driven multidrug efflux pump